MKQRLDEAMAERKLVHSRSQAQRLIKLGKVKADGRIVKKPHYGVSDNSAIEIISKETYVSRAGFKLASIAADFQLDFKGKTVLDVGSSTGGFTDYALQHGASKVIAVDVGSNQLHPTLRGNPAVELHEKTDIRDVGRKNTENAGDSKVVISPPDIVLIDVSFISLRQILPHIKTLCTDHTRIVAMCKPQFEAGADKKNKGVIKNDTMRRKVLKQFEAWAKQHFTVIDKQDSDVSGQKGNVERFYLLGIG